MSIAGANLALRRRLQMIDRPFPPPIRLLIPHSTNPLLLVTDSFKAHFFVLLAQVFEPLNLRLELRKRARPRRGGLSGTGGDEWIIELGVDRGFVHWDWAWTSLDWASKMKKAKRLPSLH